MSTHDSPVTLRRIGPALRRASNTTFSFALPVLGVVAESVTGLGIPGLEAGIKCALKIAEMVQTLKDNKEDLADLCSKLEHLMMELDRASSCDSAGELVPRLSQTSARLDIIIIDCKTLQKSHGIVRFLKGTRLAKRIAEIQQSVRDMIQNFVFFGSISIEYIIGNMASRLNKLIVSTHIRNLASAPARYDAAGTPSSCMAGTRIELLEDLMDHVTGASHSSQITIVFGIPGSGKSTIAKTIAVKLAEKGHLAASFFFSRNDGNRRELKLVFSTIAFQLAYFNHEYRHFLSEILEHDPDLANAEPWDHLDKLVIDPLSRVSLPADGVPWVIAFDAVDECGSDHGSSLLELLTSRLARLPKHIRIFLTGRPENPILSVFDRPTIEPITHKHTLSTTFEGAVSKDIHLYVTKSLGSEWDARDGWVAKDKDLEALVTRARGLFIFAATAVQYIQSRVARYHPQTTMDSILHDVSASGLGPRLLHQLYLKVVDDAVPAEDTAFLGIYQRVLGAVIYLQEPLSTTEIAELLGMKFDDVFRIVKLLNSVLSVSDGTVRIAHLSFREFITDPKPTGAHTDLFLRDSICHNNLATSCINLMNQALHQNMCGLDTSDTYALNSDVPNLGELVAQNITPALRYACVHWASHFQTNNIDPGGLERWLGTNVLFWLEALSLCEELSQALPLIAAAQTWYHQNPTRKDFTRYTALLSDTSRFITASFDTISLSAGHIYYSALPFTPSLSELSRTYGSLAQQSIRIVTGVHPIWSPLQWTVNTGKHVNDVAFSHNGEFIVSACDKAIETRSSETGKLLSTLEGHTNEVLAVALSRDGARIVSGSFDRTIRIWSSETCQPLYTLQGHTGPVYAIAFSRDGTRIVSGSNDETIRIWSSETGQSLSTLKGHIDYVNAVAFSRDETHIVSGSDDQTIRIWSSETGQSLFTFEGHTDWVLAVAFFRDGNRVVSGSSDETIRIWSLATGQSLLTLRGHTKPVRSVAVSRDGTRIVSGSNDQMIRIWSSETGQSLLTLKGHTGAVFSVAFSRDANRIVSGSYDETIRTWSSDTSQSLPIPEEHTGCVCAVAFSQDGARIVSGSDDRTIRIWSSETGRSLSTLEGHTGWVCAVAFSRDGRRIVSGSSDKTIRIWSSETGQSLMTLEGHAGAVLSVAFSRDETHIVSGSNDQTIQIWSLETEQSLLTLDGHSGVVFAVAFSRNRTHIVSGSSDKTIRIWSSETGQSLSTFEGHYSMVEAVALSLDGRPTEADVHHTLVSVNSPTLTSDHSMIEPPRSPSQPSCSVIQFGEKAGWITLSSDPKPVCILPPDFRPHSTAQFGSILALGLPNGKILILDFSRINIVSRP